MEYKIPIISLEYLAARRAASERRSQSQRGGLGRRVTLHPRLDPTRRSSSDTSAELYFRFARVSRICLSASEADNRTLPTGRTALATNKSGAGRSSRSTRQSRSWRGGTLRASLHAPAVRLRCIALCFVK